MTAFAENHLIERPESRLRHCLGVVATGAAIVAGLGGAASYAILALPNLFSLPAREDALIGLGTGIFIGVLAKTIGDRCHCWAGHDETPRLQ